MKDAAGAFCSGLCLCHCLLTPLFIAGGSLGTLGVLLASEWVHQVLLLPVALFALLSFPSAYRLHQRLLPGMFGLAGVIGLFSAVIVGGSFEVVLSVIGALMLVIAHLWNRHLSASLKAVNPA